MVFITYEEATALTEKEQIALARQHEPDMGEHIFVIRKDEMLEWTGKYDLGGWEVYDLTDEVRTWCKDHLNGEWQYRSVLYAQGRSIGADYFLHFVEFGQLSDAVLFHLKWR
jgi:hypothetical protein